MGAYRFWNNAERLRAKRLDQQQRDRAKGKKGWGFRSTLGLLQAILCQQMIGPPFFILPRLTWLPRSSLTTCLVKI